MTENKVSQKDLYDTINDFYTFKEVFGVNKKDTNTAKTD